MNEDNLESLKEFLGTYHTVEELVVMLEIEPDELLDAFEDKLYEHEHKFKGD